MLLTVITLEKPTLQKLESMAFPKHNSHGLSRRLISSVTFFQLYSCVRCRELALPPGLNGNYKGHMKQSIWQALSFYKNRLKRKTVKILPQKPLSVRIVISQGEKVDIPRR